MIFSPLVLMGQCCVGTQLRTVWQTEGAEAIVVDYSQEGNEITSWLAHNRRGRKVEFITSVSKSILF
jgi:hypothetical protein